MSKKRVLEWLQQQDYWVDFTEFDRKCTENNVSIRNGPLQGITTKRDDNGNMLVPRRDLKKAIR